MIKIKLSTVDKNPRLLEAFMNYCKNNNKLIALRTLDNQIMSVGLSLEALHNASSKEGFKYYQVIYKDIPVIINNYENVKEEEIEELKRNNFTRRVPFYDVMLCSYEGIEDERCKKEQYWFKCYQYYLQNQENFVYLDLINKMSYAKKQVRSN